MAVQDESVDETNFFARIPVIKKGISIPLIYKGKVVGRAVVTKILGDGYITFAGHFNSDEDGKKAKIDFDNGVLNHVYHSLSCYTPSDVDPVLNEGEDDGPEKSA